MNVAVPCDKVMDFAESSETTASSNMNEATGRLVSSGETTKSTINVSGGSDVLQVLNKVRGCSWDIQAVALLARWLGQENAQYIVDESKKLRSDHEIDVLVFPGLPPD